MDAAKIRKWSDERKIIRLGEIQKTMDDLEGRKREEALDETILILLETLTTVIKDNGWSDASPMSMFVGVYGNTVPTEVLERFLETKGIVEKFKTTTGREKLQLRPKLAARGII